LVHKEAQLSAPTAVPRVVASLLLLALVACTDLSDQHAVFYVFGTTVEVTLRATDESKASAAFSQLQQRFQSMHRDWHAWEPGQLTEINLAFSEGRKIAIQDDIAILIRRSQQLETATGGRFNPAIGGLIELWGFQTSIYPIEGPPPTAGAIQSWLDKGPSSLDIRIEGKQVSSSNPAVQLDFGGIAKGYAVDIAGDLLISMGVKSAIINAGGDLRAYGGNDQPWKIAVSKPGGGVIGSIEVSGDEAVFTSGSSQRYRQDQLERYPHIIDPATGWPISGLSAATVVTDEGALADAAATALLVAGKTDWPEVASALGLDTVLVVDEKGDLYMTEKMQDRLTLKRNTDTQITIITLPEAGILVQNAGS